MKTNLDFTGLAAHLLSRAGEFLPDWSPGGRLVGREYVAGGARGGPGDSFKYNTDKGTGSDFATGETFGDMIDLYSKIENISMGEAAKRLSEQTGYRLKDKPLPVRTTPADHKVGRPPVNIAPPAMTHPKWGKPSMSWPYSDPVGVLFYIARYESPEGKQFCPWSWSLTANKWVSKGWPAPRPLYGLDLLVARPEAPVLVCEGERAADAARNLIGRGYVCVSWANGATSVSKADWSPIKGKNVVLWPDSDNPGIEAMEKLAKILISDCLSVKILDVTGMPEGYDAADALADGWDYDRTVAWAKPRARLITATAVATAPGVTAAAQVNVTINTDEPPPSSASQFALWESLGLAATGQGNPYSNQDNAIRVIEKHPPLKDLLWFDEFHQKYFTLWNSKAPREWEDVDETRLTTYMQRNLGLAKMSDETIHKAAVEFAKRNPRNEPRDWMETLKWDGTPRVPWFLSEAFGAEEKSEYVWAASKNFWVGMVARIFSPGCKLDNMLVLEGPQGKFKSTALDIIGHKWFAEARGSALDKDFFLNLRGKLIMEIAELDAFKGRAEVTAIKQVITCRVDRYRAPYERSSKDHPRQSIFVGTTNERGYLRDDTGGRRFWPILCKKIQPDWIAKNRSQLFAEAVHLYKAGEKWWEMPQEETDKEQEKRRSQDEWENAMAEYLQHKSETTVREIGSDCLKIDIGKLERGIQMRIGGLLRNLGWDKTDREGGSGKIGKVWVRSSA